MTICAGAGGCGGPAECDVTSYCCCGPRGSCSFILRNGTFCLDSQGGGYGYSGCYYQCGCMWRSCGHSSVISSAWYPDTGMDAGCVQYGNGLCTRAGTGMSVVPGCSGNCAAQRTLSAGTAFGSDQQWNAYSCTCWGRYRFNTSCSNGTVSGVGGVNPPGGCVYNAASSANYACSTSDFSSCERTQQTQAGAFPGGGGGGGYTTACCYIHTSGGGGGPGYVRIVY